MGARQREISVSEFFTKNRHLLGFDNPRKALLTCVKEAVDNALDACEERHGSWKKQERSSMRWR
jgi:DNA topoisomerase-6 subunit B